MSGKPTKPSPKLELISRRKPLELIDYIGPYANFNHGEPSVTLRGLFRVGDSKVWTMQTRDVDLIDFLPLDYGGDDGEEE